MVLKYLWFNEVHKFFSPSIWKRGLGLDHMWLMNIQFELCFFCSTKHTFKTLNIFLLLFSFLVNFPGIYHNSCIIRAILLLLVSWFLFVAFISDSPDRVYLQFFVVSLIWVVVTVLYVKSLLLSHEFK